MENFQIDEEALAEATEYAENPAAARSVAVVSEAMLRIQQAKLYEILLSHSFFAPGSAEPEIQARVEAEIKEFVLERLEVLLGMRAPRSQQVAPAQLPFDEEQLAALAALANRALKRDSVPQPITPTLNTVTVQQPVPQVAQQVQRPVVPQSPGQGQARRRRTANIGEKSGKDFSQAVGKRQKPLPMPSQAIMDQMNANEAAQNMNGMSKQLGAAQPNTQQDVSSAHMGAMLAKALQLANNTGDNK
jgi:hypothetical protein